MSGIQRLRCLTIGAVASVMLLTACTAQYRQHGYIPLEEDLQMIVPGVDTRGTVEDLIGIPTTAGVVRNGNYYYIQSEVRHFAAKAPEVINRTVLAVSFDSADVVENIETYGLKDGRVVPLAHRVTRSGDGEISFIRKLFGNIGGLSAEQLLGE